MRSRVGRRGVTTAVSFLLCTLREYKRLFYLIAAARILDLPVYRCWQGAYHEKVVPTVCGLLSDPSQPARVRGHAAAAIVNFTDTEDVPEEAVAPYLDALLSALCSCLNGGVPQPVQVL